RGFGENGRARPEIPRPRTLFGRETTGRRASCEGRSRRALLSERKPPRPPSIGKEPWNGEPAGAYRGPPGGHRPAHPRVRAAPLGSHCMHVADAEIDARSRKARGTGDLSCFGSGHGESAEIV